MDPAFLNHAYVDKAFPITSGQTISQPYTVAVQTSLLRVKKEIKYLRSVQARDIRQPFWQKWV